MDVRERLISRGSDVDPIGTHPLVLSTEDYDALEGHVRRFVDGVDGIESLSFDVPTDEDPSAYWRGQFVRPVDSSRCMDVVLKVDDLDVDFDRHYELEGMEVTVHLFVSKGKVDGVRKVFGDAVVDELVRGLRS